MFIKNKNNNAVIKVSDKIGKKFLDKKNSKYEKSDEKSYYGIEDEKEKKSKKGKFHDENIDENIDENGDQTA